MKDYQKEFIELALEYNALKFGSFTLKSGRQSPYFFNMGTLTNSAALHKVGECYAKAIKDAKVDFDSLFGPAYKGIPLATATAIMLHQHFGINCGCAFDRKEIKDHGEGGQIIGSIGQKTLIIDDVITAGTAIKHALGLLQAHDAKPAGIIVALDRQEQGKTTLSAIDEIRQNQQIPVASLIKFSDIRQYVEENRNFSQVSSDLDRYRDQYGCQTH